MTETKEEIRPKGYTRKLMPPVYFFTAVLILVLSSVFFPANPVSPVLFLVLGLSLICFGCILIYSGAFNFRKRETPIRPFEDVKLIVTQGPFRFTRNPMYLGMILVLLGTGISLVNPWSFLILPLFFLVIDIHFVRHEERFLEERFGGSYLEYKQSVRRWL